ncbi:vitamin K epoxide reductase family protein [Gordonia crocea]|uniref:Membrane protein n=1 Tax=Gordonia crocea TaxID=589162 RepID=A0A7M3SV29_9ACTN|nr:vitamin K epoxide reductase family protein [Gordonia crocea]GED96503.1 membrane protein [Gordonia crocea]
MTEVESVPEVDNALETAQSDRGEFWTRAAAWLMVIGGAIGLTASSILTIEKLRLAADPGYRPSCSLNPVMACSPVMSSWQASLFGFPNPLIGIAAFAVAITMGIGVLAGARYAKWMWIGMQVAIVLALIFVHWLIYSSLYDIGKLCVYCMVVWAVTIALAVVITVRNLMVSTRSPSRALSVVATYAPIIIGVWYLLIAGAILDRFWDYWSTLF